MLLKELGNKEGATQQESCCHSRWPPKMMFVEANQVDKLLNMTQRSCKHLFRCFRCATLLGAIPELLISVL